MKRERINKLKNKIWKGAKFFVVKACIAYKNLLGGHGASSGGMFTWVSPRIQYLMYADGQLRSSWVQWMRLKGTPRKDIALSNMHAPNLLVVRCKLWVELTNILPRNYRWIFYGDLNFVEKQQKKSVNNVHMMSLEEERIFYILTMCIWYTQ